MKRSLLSFVFATAIINLFNAQSLLIDPAVEGGFELAGGFPGNGWTVVNSTTNTWNVSGAAAPFAGLNSAFISADGGITYGYNNTLIQTSHFYRDVAVPAGNGSINLKFQYKSIGEPYFDRLLVYAAPTSVFPTANNPQSSNDVIAGATLVYSDPALNASYQQVNIFLPSSFAGTTMRLIFTWQNDATSASVTSPVSIDNIYLYSQAVAPLNGVYTINNTLPTSSNLPLAGSNFNNFTDAVNYLNANGISGPVTFQVSAGQTFTESQQIISVGGTNANPVKFQKSGSGANPLFIGTNGTSSSDACFKINGADYLTFDGIDATTVVGVGNYLQQMEVGYFIQNQAAANGANHNKIKNCKISLDRNNTSSAGIFQWVTVLPGSAVDANNANTYSGNTIENASIGIYLLGTNAPGLQDDSCVVSNCSVGGNALYDIGGGTINSPVAGIWASYQTNCKVTANTVRNVANQNLTYGIFFDLVSGVSEISGNNVSGILNTGIASATVVSGIRANVPTGTHTIRIYNNFVSDIRNNYAALSATTFVRGINLQVGGGGSTTSVFEVSHNSVYIDAYSSLGSSSSCIDFSASATAGPQLRMRSNVFANFTGAQTGTAKHFCCKLNSNTLIGTAGSLSNNNDFYIFNTTNGFVGRGTTTDRATLANWQTGYTGQDANSISVDPIYTSSTDLHAANPALNSAAAAASLLPYITTDIDNQTRTTPNSDIGADEFTPSLFDVKPVSLIDPPVTACYSSSQPVSVKIMNYTGSALDFTFNPVTITVVVSGPTTQTVTTIVNNNSFNGNAPLGAFSFVTIPVGSINMAAYGNYNFTCYTSWSSDQNLSNDTIKNITRSNIAPSTLPQIVSFSGYNGSNLSSLFSGWNEANGTSPATAGSLWTSWSNFGTPGNVNAVVTLNTNIRKDWIVSPKFIPGLNTVLTYKAAVTAIASSTNQPAALGADDKLFIMVSTDCGATYQKIDSITSLTTISNSLNQFVVPLGNYSGQPIIVGFYATDGSVVDPTGCDLHLDDINISNVTNYDFSVIQLNAPLFQTCYNGSQQIIVKVKNTGAIPIDFAAENSLIYAVVSGPVPQTYSLPVTTGTLTPGSIQTFTITSSLDLSTAGQYSLKSFLSIPAGDINPSNDTLFQLIFPQNPSVSFASAQETICKNDSVQLFPVLTINGIGPATLPAFVSNHAPIAIPDSSSLGINSTITVSGAGGFASQLVGVKIDTLLHTFDGDLVLTLTAPNGSSAVLSQNNGGGGDNYLSTLFSSSASNSITSGSSPFTGAFLPQTSFNQFSGSANGNWVLNVKDISSGDVGTLVKWSLLFKEENILTNFTWSPIAPLTPNVINTYAHPDTTTTFTFTAVDMNGCAASSTVTVVVNTSPVVSVSGLADSVCVNSVAIPLQGIPSGGVFSGNGVDSTGTFNPSLAGVGISNLYYEITGSNSCVGIDTISVVVLDTPQVSFQLPLSFICSQDAPFTINGGLPSGGVYSGSGVSNGTTFNPAAATLGQQFVNYTFTDNNGCSGIAFDTIEVSLCLSFNQQLENKLIIYPNPAHDVVTIGNLQGGEKIHVIDLNGRILLTESANEANTKIDLSKFSRGVYFLSVESGDLRTLHKLVVD